MKLCKDCEHFTRRLTSSDGEPFVVKMLCAALAGRFDPVSGTIVEATDCDLMRMGTLCGWDEAKLFKPKAHEEKAA